MRVSQSRPARLVALLLTASALVAACSDGPDTTSDVFVTGSSTVEPISVAVAESLEDSRPELDVLVDIEGPGTGDGFEKFCSGGAEITDASRAIKEEEIASCQEAGIEFIELKVAYDGISVVTGTDTDIDCLTFEDLYALVGPEAEGFETWRDAEELAAELGSSTSFPKGDLEITAPGEESGTYDSFVEIVLADIGEARLEEGEIEEEQVETTRPDYSSQSDDTAIIQGIEGADGALGWVGFAFAEEAGSGIRQLEIDGGDGCVAPTAETIADGSYPISRPLFIYVNATSLEENPAVAAYVDFYLGQGIAEVEGVGYVPLPDDQFAETIDAWESRTTGTREA